MALKFLHTADWHLGQLFNGHSRDAEHAAFFTHLLGVLRERRPDALIVAGDIFDGVNPSAESQKLYYAFLANAATALPHLQIVITSGNHDAAGRLEAPAEVLKALRITVVGTVARDAAEGIDYDKFVVPLQDATGRVAALCVAVPFLRQADVPVVPEAKDGYLDGIRELYRQATAHALSRRDRVYPGVPLVGMGHLHMQDGAMSDGAERKLVVGNAEAVRNDTFPTDLAYVALGHLHKPQELDGGRIRYCGSPLPLSFSEKDYAHRLVEVTLDATGLVSAETLPLPRAADLVRIPRTGALPLTGLLLAIEAHPFDATLPQERQPFLELRVLDDGPDPKRTPTLRAALENKPVRLIAITPVSPANADAPESVVPEAPVSLADLASLDPAQIMINAHRERFKTEPDASLLAALREILTAETLA